jgi:hypothetical protein
MGSYELCYNEDMTIILTDFIIDEIARLAQVHQSMKRRCFDTNSSSYTNYGGRGITISTDWLHLPNFVMWALQNGSKKGLQLDRIDNDGPYSSENCEFVTAVVNMNNRRNSTRGRRSNEAFGESKSLKDWAKDSRCKVKFSTLNDRVSTLKWNLEKAITTPKDETRGGKLYEAFGESKTRASWVRDERCVVGYPTLCSRLTKGMSLEEAITKPGREIR